MAYAALRCPDPTDACITMTVGFGGASSAGARAVASPTASSVEAAAAEAFGSSGTGPAAGAAAVGSGMVVFSSVFMRTIIPQTRRAGRFLARYPSHRRICGFASREGSPVR